MIHARADWRIKLKLAAWVFAAAALPLAGFACSTAQAQNMMRTPNLNVGAARLGPTVGPTVTSRIDPNIARVDPHIGDRAAIGTSRLTTSSGCTAAYRNSDGSCSNTPVSSSDGGGTGSGSRKGKGSNSRRDSVQAAFDPNAIQGHVVAEIGGSLTDAQLAELARRHRLVLLQSEKSQLIGSTISLFRITDKRTFAAVKTELAREAGVVSLQPSFRYVLQDQNAAPTEGDPAQYALAKLRLPEAHKLARGANVTIAVIDSGVDVKHPELAGSIAETFDALDSKEGPHLHGTGIAGAIVAHARLMSSAPAARILAIRAFGLAPNGAQSNSFIILKSLDYAAAHGAQIVNMSFAGPKDALIERAIAATAAKGIVMAAASGNAGPKSPPLYPAANPSVIAVSATDAQDRLFAASNRGGNIAVAAPGVDIFLPAPDDKYQMTSGTSFAAAYVSGLIALMLERNPKLTPDQVRAILMKTARDLGAPGRDDLFGAGEADAFAAVSAVGGAPAAPVTAATEVPAAEKASDRQDIPATRAPNEPPATIAADKSAAGNGEAPAIR